MKNPLSYQISEYDCGPTSVINALMYLYDRESIKPDLINNIYKYTLDRYNKRGIQGMYGTSDVSMYFLSQYFNHYSKSTGFKIYCECINNEHVYFKDNDKFIDCVKNKGVIILKCISGVPHYILITDIIDDDVYIFDSYYRKRSFNLEGVEIINEPFKANRVIKKHVLDCEGKSDYNLGKVEDRIAVLMYNTTCSLKKNRRKSK